MKHTILRSHCISYIVYAKATINCNNYLSSSDRTVSLFLSLFEETEEKKNVSFKVILINYRVYTLFNQISRIFSNRQVKI